MRKKVVVKSGGKTYTYVYTDDVRYKDKPVTRAGVKYVYKPQTYREKRGGKSAALVGKRGKVYQKRIDELLAAAPDRTTRNEIQAEIYNWQRHHKGQKLTMRGLTSVLEDNRYAKMFINAGYTVEEAAKSIGTTVDALLDPANWSERGRVLTIGKDKYSFEFSYYKSVLKKMKNTK